MINRKWQKVYLRINGSKTKQLIEEEEVWHIKQTTWHCSHNELIETQTVNQAYYPMLWY